MNKNQKILLGVGLGVLVVGSISVAVYISNKKKKEAEARQLEYQRSIQNSQNGGSDTNGTPTTGSNIATILGSIGTLWANRPKKEAEKDPRDVEKLATTPITKIGGAPNVPPPVWSSGFDGGTDYVEVGSELNDLN